jgi:flagellar biogenesis protein FliO
MRGIALWERILRLGRRAPRRLRLCESLPLGERRFVAVVEFDRERFLVGGTASSLVLLSRLEESGSRTGNEVEDAS